MWSITTDRLILREVTETDIPELVSLHAHPDVERFMDRFGPDDAKIWLERQRRSWNERGYGRMAIADRTTGRLLGRTGLAWLAGIAETQDLDETELGWTLRRDAWGHGYATEAALAVTAWAFDTIGLEQLVSMIEEGNDRSIRVAQRLGMSVVRTGIWYGRKMSIHSLTAAQLQAMAGR